MQANVCLQTFGKALQHLYIHYDVQVTRGLTYSK